MNWRNLGLQTGALLLAFVIIFVGAYVYGGNPGDTPGLETLVVLVAFYFVAAAGAHLYLAVRGEDGDLPLTARWRFVAVVLVVATLVSTGTFAGGYVGPIAGIDPAVVLGSLAVAVLIVYFGYEAREGYRAFREEESL